METIDIIYEHTMRRRLPYSMLHWDWGRGVEWARKWEKGSPCYIVVFRKCGKRKLDGLAHISPRHEDAGPFLFSLSLARALVAS